MRFDFNTLWGTLCLLCLLCQPLGAWDAAGQGNQGKRHPTPENTPSATDPSLVIDVSDDSQWQEGPYVPDTTGMKTETFGREDGELYELLAWVQDIAIDGHGSIFILDADWRSSFGTVHVINREARYLESIGSTGEGPGEFIHPLHILVDDVGERFLIAGNEREVDIFERQDTGAYRYVNSWDTRTGANSACIMRNHVYLLGYDPLNGHSIHKYTVDGEYVTGFGEPYKSTNPMVVDLLSTEGSLSCIAQQGVVGHVRDNIPVLTAFSEHGDLLWRVKVEGIKPEFEVLESFSSDGSVSVSFMAYPNDKGRGRLNLSEAYSDGNFYLGVSKSLGDKVKRNLVFRVDALSGTFTHAGHGNVSYVTERDLIVRLRPKRGSAPQVVVRSRQ